MKVDEARSKTNKKLEKMEKEISDIYKRSSKDIAKKWNNYMAESEKKIQPLQQDYDAAKKSGDKELIKETGKKLGQAKREQTLQNNYYKDMLNATTDQLAKVNQTALDYINEKMPEIYTINYNQASDIAINVGIKYNLINENVVKRRVLDGDIKLPNKNVNIPKDERWNTKQLNSSVLQGIIQGESMQQIANRIYPIVDRNKNAAIRNARTMVTGAENVGRLDSYKQLQDDGLILRKVWMATPDGRTRDWHIDMDGQEVELDQYFIDGLGNELEYPGDPGGAPETVYNCRCTMVTDVKGFRRADGSISEIDYENEPTLHDEQIAAEKEARKIIKISLQGKTNNREKSFAEKLVDKQYSPNIYTYSDVQSYWNAKAEWQGEKTQYIEDMFDYGKFTTESAWSGDRNNKIPIIEGTIAELNNKYPMLASGDREYGSKLNHLTVCDYNRAWEFLPNGEADRRITDGAAAQVFINDNNVVIAFNRGTIIETLSESINNRQNAINNGDILSSIGYSPEITTIHEWGHIMSNHLDNAMIYEDETVVEYWNWYKSLSKDDIRKGISDYATTNRGEFEAECFAELQMPEPRPIALKFKEYLDDVIKKGY